MIIRIVVMNKKINNLTYIHQNIFKKNATRKRVFNQYSKQ